MVLRLIQQVVFFFLNEETRDVVRFCHCMRKCTRFQVHCTVIMHTWGFTLNEINQILLALYCNQEVCCQLCLST